MSSPDPTRRKAVAILALGGVALVSGCTLAPLHSAGGPRVGAIGLRFARPQNRHEQLFFRALGTRLAQSADPGAPLLDVSVSISDSRIGLSRVSGPVQDRQVVARARYRVISGNDVLLEGERTATGTYQRPGQILANDAARAGAEADAIETVAQAVYLALAAALAP